MLIERTAKTATSTVGTSATSMKTPDSRMCSRDPAERERRSAISRATRARTSAAITRT
jgi:hypothetical protein